jgi:hypothetical protein
LTLIAAPALLTNASSVLALGTSNRFARAVDRQRQLTGLLELDDGQGDSEQANLRLSQLRRAERRAELILRALTSCYTSLGSFAAASLISLLGAVFGEQYMAVSFAVRGLALGIGLVGVGGLVFGCSLLIRETRITLAGLREEAQFIRARFQSRRPGGAPAGAAAQRDGPPA